MIPHRHGIAALFALALGAAGCESPTLVATDDRRDGAADRSPDAGTLSACVPAIDLDGDGATDDRCAGGTDCDDRSVDVHPGAPEVCGNGLDDDCDGSTDGTGCVEGLGATCASPTIVTASIVVSAGLYPAGACDDAPEVVRGSHVIRVDLSEPSRLSMALAFPVSLGDSGPVLAQLSCGARSGTCISSSLESPMLLYPELPPGEHFFEVSGPYLAGGTTGAPASWDVAIEITPRGAAPVPPPNDTCVAALTVPATRGTTSYAVDLRAAGEDPPTCVGAEETPAEGGDAFYRLDITEPLDLTLDFASALPGGVALHAGDCVRSTALRCAPVLTESVFVRSLAPGSYLIEVIGQAPSFLSVTLGAPTVPRPGETCRDPIPLVPGVWAADTLSDRDRDYDDEDTECSFPLAPGYELPVRDVVYDFTLTEPSEVEVYVRGGEHALASIQRTCGTTGSVPAQRCFEYSLDWYGDVYRTRVSRLEAGHYFVIVEGLRATTAETLLRVGPPLAITELTGHADCASAFVLPTTPGRYGYAGTFPGGSSAVFRVDLAAAGRFLPILTGESGVGELLWAHRCGGDEPSVGGPLDHGPSFAAGTYYFELVPLDSPRYDFVFEIGGP